MKTQKNKIIIGQFLLAIDFYYRFLIKNKSNYKFANEKFTKYKFNLKIYLIFKNFYGVSTNKINIIGFLINKKIYKFLTTKKKFIIAALLSFISQIQILRAEILVENFKTETTSQNTLNNSSQTSTVIDPEKNILTKGNIDINNLTEISYEKSNMDYGLSLGFGKKFPKNFFGNNIILYHQIFASKNLGTTSIVNNVYGYKLIFAKNFQNIYLGLDLNLAKLNYQNIKEKSSQNYPNYSVPIGLVIGFRVFEKINFQINLNNNYFAQKFQNQKTKINQLTMGLVYDF